MLSRIISSQTRIKIIKHFLDNPNKEFYISEVALNIHAGWSKVYREINNLLKINLLLDRQTSYKHFFRLNRQSPVYQPFKQLFKTLSKK